MLEGFWGLGIGFGIVGRIKSRVRGFVGEKVFRRRDVGLEG